MLLHTECHTTLPWLLKQNHTQTLEPSYTTALLNVNSGKWALASINYSRAKTLGLRPCQLPSLSQRGCVVRRILLLFRGAAPGSGLCPAHPPRLWGSVFSPLFLLAPMVWGQGLDGGILSVEFQTETKGKTWEMQIFLLLEEKCPPFQPSGSTKLCSIWVRGTWILVLNRHEVTPWLHLWLSVWPWKVVSFHRTSESFSEKWVKYYLFSWCHDCRVIMSYPCVDYHVLPVWV